MATPDQNFKIERFPSGKRPSQALLGRFTRENGEIGTNAGRYAIAYTEHVTNSKNFILESARGRSGKAIVFGMGNAIDIPVEELGNQFREVVVVDIDEKTPSERLARLDPDLQRKFTLVVDDVMGLVSPLGARLSAVEGRSRSVQAFLSHMAREWRTMDPVLPDFGSDYDFACSSLIASQLGAQPHIIASSALARKFNLRSAGVSGPEAIDYFTSITALVSRLHTDHLDLVKGSLVPDGKAYYSDTIAEASTALDLTTLGTVLTSDWKIMIQPDLVRTDIPQRFDILEDRSWLWNRIPPTIGKPGSIFTVFAYNLQPRS